MAPHHSATPFQRQTDRPDAIAASALQLPGELGINYLATMNTESLTQGALTESSTTPMKGASLHSKEGATGETNPSAFFHFQGRWEFVSSGRAAPTPPASPQHRKICMDPPRLRGRATKDAALT
jgi:hypothetical protein